MSLVTKAVLHRRANQPSALIRVQVQALHPLEGTEHQGQQQLCVPFVFIEGESYRKRQKPAVGQPQGARVGPERPRAGARRPK